jgi:presenilin-like A22 family membrane protease
MEEPGVRIDHPNRRKASSKLTRVVVVLLLLASAGLVAIISIGGWDAIEGAKPLQVAYIVLYVMLAVFVLRWNRGVLPLIAALAIVLLIFAAVSAPEWFDRDKAGFTDPALDESILGLLTALLVPVQILLIAFAMSGFRQAWNVEVELRDDEPPPPDRAEHRGPAPAAA